MKGKKYRRQMKRLHKMLADGTRHQGGAYKDGKRHGPWVEIRRNGTVVVCEYKEGAMVGRPRKLKKGHWPPVRATVRAQGSVSARSWGRARMHGPPLQGGRADGNQMSRLRFTM